jgi:hypothetical protein
LPRAHSNNITEEKSQFRVKRAEKEVKKWRTLQHQTTGKKEKQKKPDSQTVTNTNPVQPTTQKA